MLQMLKTLTSGILEKAKTFKGDWNENDSSSPNYIKNRTHWIEDPKETVLFNQSFTPENLFTEFQCNFSFEVGKEYIVNFNDVIYTCTATAGQFIGIGNSSAFMNGDFSSGEPFYIFMPESNYLVIIVGTRTPITLTISTLVEKIHKIDKKYLPSMNYVSYTEGQNLTYTQQENVLNNIGDVFYDTIHNQGFVSYSYSQSLSTTKQKRARNNIGAGTSNFSGSYNDLTDKPSSLPTVTTSNNGAFLRVVDGAWATVALPSAEEGEF